MKARITDEFDLVLYWGEGGHSEITWSACSESEFEVSGRICIKGNHHFQGVNRFEFSTFCYADSLHFFADELRNFVSGSRSSARYLGTQDMEILIRKRQGQGYARNESVIACDFRYDTSRSLGLVSCEGAFQITLGSLQEPDNVLKAITEVLRVFQMKEGNF